ncbi:hypothetical protein CQW23_26349 [Capsicum baccatum]|uniref:Uncharacterized protein n=1 Tax=Capsicum baccatum TaxID=33114 RepID=A0A2G2VNL3_CAPBA|nr:hypothetical protein CQW23_26349 [Capsicum baccatum]
MLAKSLKIASLISVSDSQFLIPDNQFLLNYPNSQIGIHDVLKIPAQRIRQKSGIFKSPYLIEFGSSSKADESSNTDLHQKHAFDWFSISEELQNGLILLYYKWIMEGLLKNHANKTVSSSAGFKVESHQLAYASLLWNYEVFKVKKRYVSDNDNPPRPRLSYVPPLDESSIASLE